jgi:hypothetical protein
MKTIKELHAQLRDIFNIIYRAISFYRDSYYLSNPDTDEERTIANSSSFIKKTRYAYWFITVIELCKLFGKKNDHYSFYKLLNTLCNNLKSSEWNTSHKLQLIKSLQERINSNDISLIVNNLHGIRDQYYAHSDKSPEKSLEEYTPNFQEVEKLIELGKYILTSLANELCELQFGIEPPGKRRTSNILEDLYNLEQYEKEKLVQELNRNKNR